MPYTTINKPSLYFNTKLYTGTGATNSITGIGFQPDWVWIKQRGGATWHNLYDVLRGTTKALASNDGGGDDTRSTGLTAFNSDGFTVGADANANGSSNTYVAWNWLANGAGVSNTSGTITSTVSANTTAGFSIATYTGNGTSGATVGHGLGVAPRMFITKSRNSASNWRVYHASIGNTAGLALNTTGASDTNSGFFNNTSPSSTVLTLGDGSTVNSSGINYVAYSFAEVKGFSKFSSYTGNGNADGTFVYTGFKPAWLMMKRTDTLSQWRLWDNKRNTFNVADTVLLPNDSGADTTNSSQYVDLLSNGFKWRASYVDTNASGGTFIYAAFAENPFVSSTFVPTTAR